MSTDSAFARRAHEEDWLPTLELAILEVFEIMMGCSLTCSKQTRAAFLHCRSRRGQTDSRAAPPKPRSGTLRHDASLELASVFRQKDPPTPRRGMAANPKKHRIFSGVK